MPETLTLPNGCTVILDPSHDHAAAVVIASRVGSRYESPDTAGLTHLAEHFLLKATTHRYPTEHALLTALDRLHAEANASTSPDLTMVWGEVQPRKLPALLSILAECFLHPRITEGLLSDEKGVVDEERADRETDPGFQAFGLFLRSCFFGSTLAWHSLGNPRTVERCSAAELRRLWYRITRPGNLVVVVSGSFDPDRIRTAVTRRFQQLRPGSAPAPPPFQPKLGRRVEVTHGRVPNAPVGLGFGFAVPGFESPDRLPLAVLANVLGGKDSARIPTLLRGDGLAYYSKASTWHWRDTGYLLITTQCSRGNVVAVTRRILDALRELRAEPIPRPVFEDAVRFLKNGAREQRHRCLHRAKLYAAQHANYGRAIGATEYVHQLSAVRRSDVQRVARRTFTTRRLHAVLHGAPTRAQLTQWKSLLRI